MFSGGTLRLTGSEFPDPGLKQAVTLKVPSPNRWAARGFPTITSLRTVGTVNKRQFNGQSVTSWTRPTHRETVLIRDQVNCLLLGN